MSIINLNILREEKPYFIVVSDEGPASSPKQHPDFASAYEESLRLAKLHPNVKFGVFEYKGHAVGSKPKKTKTEWFFVYKSGRLLSQFYGTEERARQMSLDGAGKVSELVLGGPYPVETEVPAETTVRFKKPQFWPCYPSQNNSMF